MSQLAIKGYATRGREVIQLLEMLGGKNIHRIDAIRDYYVYFVMDDKNKTISSLKLNQVLPEQFIIYSLEEFEEKFPYKVGDKVYNIIHNENQTITEVAWDFQEDEIVYQTNNNDYLFVNYLQPYEEENYCQVIGNDTSSNGVNTSASSINKEPEPKAPILSNRYDYAEGKCGYVIPDGYEFDYIKEGFQTEIILKPKKPTYPKDYKECCEVLGYSGNYNMILTTDIDCKLFNALYRLKVCRDAYWKIAGEYMGLDKPWKPDYDSGVNKYGIISMNGAVQKSNPTTNWERHLNKVLEFPTEEMRDAFFENFKDLIEQCKELL